MPPLPDTSAARPAARPARRRAWKWWAARPTLAAAVIYALLSLVFVGQGLLPGRTLSSADFLWSTVPWDSSRPPDVAPLGANFEAADAVVVFQPFFEYSHDAFPDIPLWNPNLMAGRPFLADAQSAVFSPFTIPAYVLPLSKALGVMALLKLFVAAFGTYLFGRALGMRFGGALLAGIVFAFGTFFVVWLPWPLTNVFPLLPWLLLATELLIRRPEPLPAAGLAALVALQFFGGHPETSFHFMFVTVVYFVARLLQRRWREGRRALVRPTVTFGLALAAGGALAAVVLLPLAELLLHSADLAHRQDSAPTQLDERFLGAFFLNDYWGRPTQQPLVPFVSNRGLYAGGITLMLGAVGLVLRPKATRVGFAVFAGLILVAIMGVEPFAWFLQLPGFASAHNGRMVVFVLFALAMLAGWGLDELSSRSAAFPRRNVALAAAVALFCVPVVWMVVAGTLHPGQLKPALKLAWLFDDQRPLNPLAAVSGATVATIRLSALLQWLPLAGAGLLLIGVRLLDIRPRGWVLPAGAFVALAVVVLVADLFRANMGFNPAIPIDHAEQPATGAVRYLQSQTPNRFAGLDSKRNLHPLPPDLANRYGLYDARGYDYPVVKRYDTWWRATAGPPEFFSVPTAEAMDTAGAIRGMSLLSVADVLQDPTDPPSKLPGLKLAYSGPDARVYKNENALPRTFLVGRQQVVDGGDAALAATKDAAFDARRVAVTEREVPGIATTGGADVGTARLDHYGGERVVAKAAAKRRSLLVLTDVYYPGWKAKVDGKDAPIERVDYLLRGVVVPAGTHEVEFSYEPASWRVGWIMSLLALAGLAIVVVVGLRRRRP
jgi:membrane protein YfhO